MARDSEMEDSQNKWKYIILLSKFIFSCIDVSISKSFGVLIPAMMIVLQTNTRTLGLVCSLPSALIYLASPAVAYALNKGVATPRMCALIGAILSSACLATAGLIMSVPALVISLTMTGTGLSMGYLSSKIMLNEYFKGSYVLVAAIANLGNTTGALIAPYIVERSLEAYGYVGAMLVLGGISLHAIPASVALRNPPETPMKSSNREREAEALILDEEPSSKRYLRKKRQPASSNQMITEDNQQNRPAVSLGSHDTTIKQKFKNLVQSCIFIQEPLMTISSPSIFLTFFGLNSWVLFLVPRAEWHGIPSSNAVFLSTLAGAGGIIGRLVYIVFIYFGANAIFLSLIFNMISAITFLMDPLITTFPEMCVVAFIQGWCLFSCQVSTCAYPKYAASDQNFALAAGLQGLMAGMGAIVGGFISGLIKDASQSFTTVFLVIGAVFTVNSMTTLLFLVAYRRKGAVPSPRGD